MATEHELKPDRLYRWAKKPLPDGRLAFLIQMAFTWRLCVSAFDDELGYDDGWCYHDLQAALAALANWDGTGEPAGWHRHPSSGRRRPEGDPAREHVNP